MRRNFAWLAGAVAAVLAIGVGVAAPTAFDGAAAARHVLANTSGPAAQSLTDAPAGTAPNTVG